MQTFDKVNPLSLDLTVTHIFFSLFRIINLSQTHLTQLWNLSNQYFAFITTNDNQVQSMFFHVRVHLA